MCVCVCGPTNGRTRSALDKLEGGPDQPGPGRRRAASEGKMGMYMSTCSCGVYVAQLRCARGGGDEYISGLWRVHLCMCTHGYCICTWGGADLNLGI